MKRSQLWRRPLPFPTAVRLCWACLSGRTLAEADALRVLDELHRRRKGGYVPAAAFLNAYLGLGDTEEAFAWLERAAEERSNIMQWLKVHPFFDPLRGDPRFAEFLRRANFSPEQRAAAP